MKTKNYFLKPFSAFILISCSLSALSAAPALYTAQEDKTTRAIFDVGSGSTKVLVADVDPHSQKILHVRHYKERPIPFKRDMAVSGQTRFSEELQLEAMEAFAELKEELAPYQPAEWAGIATSAARTAENGQEFFDHVNEMLGIKITVVPASEEGRLGYMTALASNDLPKEKLISYDSGGGSFQIASEIDGKLEVLQGDFAYIPALETLITEIRGLPSDALEMEINGKKLTATPNPISIEEADDLVFRLKKLLPSPSEFMAARLKDPEATVVGIGNEEFIFAYGAQALGKNTYTKEELGNAIEIHCGKKDEELTQFANSKEPVLGMILLYSVMDGLGIEKLTYSPSHGICEGLAIDEIYWSSPKQN